jgi:hypothetical protein
MLISRRAPLSRQSTSATAIRILCRIVRALLAREGGRAEDARTRRTRGIRTRGRDELLRVVWRVRIQGVAAAGWRRRGRGVHEELVVLALRGAVGAVGECAVAIVAGAVGGGGGAVGIVVAGYVAESVVGWWAAAAAAVLLVMLRWRRLLAVGVLLAPVVLPVRHGGCRSWGRQQCDGGSG